MRKAPFIHGPLDTKQPTAIPGALVVVPADYAAVAYQRIPRIDILQHAFVQVARVNEAEVQLIELTHNYRSRRTFFLQHGAAVNVGMYVCEELLLRYHQILA
jgi:hypothetical protein